MLRVLAALPYPHGHVGGQRYRIEQWAPLIEKDGIEITFSPFLSADVMRVLYEPGHLSSKLAGTLAGHARRFAELFRVGRYDALFVYREAALLGPAWFEWAASRRVPIVFDFDDAIYLPGASQANRWALALKPRHKTASLCRLARHVTVGNRYLADFAGGFARAVTILPSTIDTDLYRLAPRQPKPRAVVGWTGSPTTVLYVEALGGMLRRLRREVDFELRIVGGQLAIEGVDVKCIPWRAATEVADLSDLDVGLMPLRDDEWSRGKCGMKALQYMALGIPPVVSPVGVNAEIVKDGENGFHARTDDEWIERILRLLRDAELRARLGAAARRTVEAGYSARVQAPRLANVFRAAVAERARP